MYASELAQQIWGLISVHGDMQVTYDSDGCLADPESVHVLEEPSMDGPIMLILPAGNNSPV